MAYGNREGNRSGNMKGGNTKFGAGSEVGGHLQKAAGTLGGGYDATQPDKSGVEFGLSSLSGFNAEDGGLYESMGRDPFTGNPLSRVEMNPQVNSASAKGKKFTIC